MINDPDFKRRTTLETIIKNIMLRHNKLMHECWIIL